MNGCPDVAELSVLLLDDLTDTAVSLKAHVEGCASCREKLGKLGSLLEVQAQETPPVEVLEGLRKRIAEDVVKESAPSPKPLRLERFLKSRGPLWITAAAAAALIVVEIMIPSLLAARRHGDDAVAIGALRTINTEEILFRDSDKEQDGNNDYGMLSELSNTGLIDSVLGSGRKQGYMFRGAYSPRTGEFLWFGTGNPGLPGSTGDRYFEINTAGVIYYTTGRSLTMDTNTTTIPNRIGEPREVRIVDVPRTYRDGKRARFLAWAGVEGRPFQLRAHRDADGVSTNDRVDPQHDLVFQPYEKSATDEPPKVPEEKATDLFYNPKDAPIDEDFVQAARAFDEGRFEDAEKNLGKVLSAKPSDEQARLYRDQAGYQFWVKVLGRGGNLASLGRRLLATAERGAKRERQEGPHDVDDLRSQLQTETDELKGKLAEAEDRFNEFARKSDAEKTRLIDEKERAELFHKLEEAAIERDHLGRRLSELTAHTTELQLAHHLTTTTELRTKTPALLARPEGPDQRELPLSALRVSTVLMATRARTLIDCTFDNPYATQLQGTLMIRLPEGASPCYLGMFQGAGPPKSADPSSLGSLLPPILDDPAMLLARKIELPSSWYANGQNVSWGTLRPAEVVEEKQAKVVYEQVTRQRVDPALMEWSGGNNFSTRVFPILPNSRKRVFFVYDQPAPDMGGRATLALAVPEKPPQAFRLEVACDPRAYGDAALMTCKGDRKLESAGKFLRTTLENVSEGSFLLAATPRTPAVRAGFSESAGIAGSLVHARLMPQVKLLEGRKTGSAVFLLDTSFSQKAKLGASCGKLLRAILEKDATLERFSVVTFDVTARPLFEGFRENKPEEREKTLKEVESLWLEGATSLEAGLACVDRTLPPGEHPTCFLLSDAQVTWGQEDPRELEREFPRMFQERWICYQIGDAAVSRPIVESLVRSGGRIVPIVSSQEIEAAALAHATTPVLLRSVHVDGVAASDLVVAGKPRAFFPGEVVEVAFRCPQSSDPRKASLVIETENGTERFPLEGASDSDQVSARAWAELTATSLLELQDKDADRVAVALSQQFALANRVASFLILESDQEYKRYEIKNEELDLVKLQALAASREAKRPIGAPDMSGLDARALAFLEKLGEARIAPWKRAAWPRGGASLGPTHWGERLDAKLVWAECARRAEAGRGDEALRIVSSLVEESPRDARALRLVGFALMSLGRYEDAVSVFARTRVVRPFEPQAYLTEALALESLGRASEAALLYEIVLAGHYDQRFERFAKESAQRLYARLLAKLGDRGADRLGELGLATLTPFPAHEAHLFWNLDDTDVDLHVREEKGPYDVNYQHPSSPNGGLLHGDDTAGLGPEIYTHPQAEPATIAVDYFGTRSVEGTVPAATLLVYFRQNGSAEDAVVRAALLPQQKVAVVLYRKGDK